MTSVATTIFPRINWPNFVHFKQ